MKGMILFSVFCIAALSSSADEITSAIAATFSGKTAVITGAASGMGLCTSKTLAQEGCNVFMCDINEKGVKKAADEINALGKGKAYAVVADVRKFADAERSAALAMEKTGRIDLLINYAGGNEARCCKSFKPFYEQPVEVIDWGLDVNLKGAVYFSRACMPYMVKAKSGVIVCIGSVTGFEGDGCGSMYGTAKSGLHNFVVGLAKAGSPYGVRAFCVSPGPVLTRPAMAKMTTSLGFASQPQEIVDYVLYMASPKGRSVTGTTHIIDAGRLALPRSSTSGFLEAEKKK
ncbi:MAG: SDR family oxidoreductase [Kiritimatiellae bacterium]|nr:SDR family oxidoreductase [Kiritimatiellia bacterium]